MTTRAVGVSEATTGASPRNPQYLENQQFQISKTLQIATFINASIF